MLEREYTGLYAGTMTNVENLPMPSLTLVTDRNLYRRQDENTDPLSLIEAAIEGGVHIVQLRVRQDELDELALFAVSLRLRELTEGRALYVVTGDLELAEKCYADGVLLPEQSYRPSDARTFLRGEGQYVGAFARDVAEAGRAERGGADYVQVGPIYADDSAHGNELALLRKVKDAVHIPVIAFGGIQTPDQVVDCIRAGADGVAVTDAIARAEDPRTTAVELRTALDAAWRAIHGDI